MNNRSLHIIYLIGVLGILFGFAGCANRGAPEGGPFDVTPPRLVRAFPEQGARNVSEKRIVLRFDEFIKLVNQQDKLIISPPQKTAARISASGKVVDIHLEDTLKPNTTYSFYFDDALVDNNEDNPLEDFSYSFSTGETLDSMQLLGTVLDAQTLEPVQNLMLGAYFASMQSDTLLSSTPIPFISKTNRMGQFVIRGLKDSSYLVFGLKDDDNDLRYSQPTEGLAFDGVAHKTWLLDSIRTDTIRIDSIVRRDTLHRDSLVTYPYTYYYPRDLLLRYFVSDVKRMGIERYDRLDSMVCRVEFASIPDSVPTMYLLDSPQRNPQSVYIASIEGKGINYWLRDSLLMQADSLRFGITYAKTDSLMQTATQTDTLTFYKPKAKTSSNQKKDKKEGFTVKLEASKGIKSQTPRDSLFIVLSRPTDSISSSAISVNKMVDTVATPILFEVRQDTKDKLRYHLDIAWSYGEKYKIDIDSLGVQSIYSDSCEQVSLQHEILQEKEFGRIQLSLQGLDVADSLIVAELLDKSGAVLEDSRASAQIDSMVQQAKSMEADSMLTKLLAAQSESKTSSMPRTATEKEGISVTDSTLSPANSTDSLALTKDSVAKQKTIEPHSITFVDLKPADYYLRIYIDSNADGHWTTGKYPDQQPEMVYYYPKALAVKKGFTTSEVWFPLDLPLDKQKPEELRKTKPEEKRKRENKNIEYYKRLRDKRGKQGSASMELPSGLPTSF